MKPAKDRRTLQRSRTSYILFIFFSIFTPDIIVNFNKPLGVCLYVHYKRRLGLVQIINSIIMGHETTSYLCGRFDTSTF